MGVLLDVILPVFLVLGFGYFAVWRGYLQDAAIDGLMKFAQSFAIPCLLFRAISTLDLQQNFDFALLGSFYAGAIAGFAVAFSAARYLFQRDWEDCVAIGFVGLFSNSLLLGVPITERAYGTDALEANYAIIAVHSPICYLIGITAMEIARNRGGSIAAMSGKIVKAIFSNALIVGVTLGFIANITQLQMPGVIMDAIDLIVGAALPTALFGLGGVLYRYRPEGDIKTIMFVVGVSLIMHPAIVWGLVKFNGLSTEVLRSAVITAAAPPGINAYLFANMYGKARRVAASAVLIGTTLSIFSVWGWLHILP